MRPSRRKKVITPTRTPHTSFGSVSKAKALLLPVLQPECSLFPLQPLPLKPGQAINKALSLWVPIKARAAPQPSAEQQAALPESCHNEAAPHRDHLCRATSASVRGQWREGETCKVTSSWSTMVPDLQIIERCIHGCPRAIIFPKWPGGW